MNEITQKLMEPFSQDSIKTRPGKGGQTLRYLEGSTVLRRLIAATDNQFDFRILEINEADNVVFAKCEIEIPGLGKRQHIGSARINGSEDAYKASVTDSLKKILTLFGEGLDLYSTDEQEVAVQTPAQNPQAQSGYGNGNGQGQRPAVKPAFTPIRKSA